MSCLLAIDPGMTGALAWITAEGHLVEVVDMPVAEIDGKRQVWPEGVAALMGRRPVHKVIIERTVAMHRRSANGDGSEEATKMGAASTGTFFYGAGILRGCAAAFGLPVEMEWPHLWKRRAGVPTDKTEARQMAQRTWPGAAKKFARVKDDGRAEACLMGRWAALRAR